MNQSNRNTNLYRISRILWELIKGILLLAVAFYLLKIVVTSLQPLESFTNTPGDFFSFEYLIKLKIFFSSDYQSIEWRDYIIHIRNTCFIIVIALFWSTSMSYLLGYKRAQTNHSRFWDFLSFVYTLWSGVPLFIIGLIIFMYRSEIQDFFPFSNIWNDEFIKLCLAGIALGSCEGALAELPRNFKNIISKLMNQTYYLSALTKGQKTGNMIYRAIKPYIWRNLPTRISYFFGATIIIERSINITGLGNSFVEYLFRPDLSYSFQIIMFCGFIIIFFPVATLTMTNIQKIFNYR